MRAVVQRVSQASVTSDGELTGEIGLGLMVLLGVAKGDTDNDAKYLAEKTVGLRIFEDDDDKMNLALSDVGGEMLVVSQFTLAADTSRGNRPGFSSAAPPDEGNRLYEYFAGQLQTLGLSVAKGQFGADMKVSLLNDGPVTIWMES